MLLTKLWPHTSTEPTVKSVLTDGANKSNVGLSSAEANSVSLLNSDTLAEVFGLSVCTHNHHDSNDIRHYISVINVYKVYR